ncbi:hypothetical protein C9994_03185 [Marivirga lumbricoides]|uniref:Uncharacterized protein n=1 Tax=Marivirga lumbricoides TaxID=1046115 RepID=A0A2T4DU40_9BACT|nr:hypothetical protein C9994_03185 [Marivirga lumbricoides]
MTEKQIKKLISIKTIGWTTTIVFSLLTLGILIQIAGTLVLANSFDNSSIQQEEFNEITMQMIHTKNRIMAIYFIACAITLLIIVGSIGLINLKTWGLIIYQSFTIVLTVFLLMGLTYYTYHLLYQIEPNHQEFDMNGSDSFRTIQKYITLSYGIFILLVSWMLTRVNIFLGKKETRVMFE